jgi:hypothetical protein
MSWSPLNVFIQLLVLGVIGVGAVAAVVAARRGRAETARRLAIGLSTVAVLHVGAAIAVSLASREVVLPHRETKHFCGFYLDCHLNVAVMDVNGTPAIGNGQSQRTAEGNFFFVTIRVGSDAESETLSLHRPGVRVIDDMGRTFDPLPAGTPGLEGVSGPEGLSQPVAAGKAYLTVLAFDLPQGLTNPRLQVTEMEGVWPARLFEMFLIGDEDSLLHRKTTFSLN